MFQQSPPLSSVNRVNRAQKLLNLQAVFIQQTLKTANSDEEIAFKQKEKDMAAYSRSLGSPGGWPLKVWWSIFTCQDGRALSYSGDIWWYVVMYFPEHSTSKSSKLQARQLGGCAGFRRIPSLTVLCSLICSERFPCCNMWVIRRKVKSLFQQVDSSGDGTLNLEECLDSESPNRCHIYIFLDYICLFFLMQFVCIYNYIYIHCIYIYLWLHICILLLHVCIYMCVWHAWSFIYIYIYVHTHMYIYIYVHIVVTSFVSKVPELGALYSQASPHFSTFSQDPSGPWAAQVFQAGVFFEAEILDVTVGTWAPWHEPLSIGTMRLKCSGSSSCCIHRIFWCTWDVWNMVSMAGQLVVTSCKGTTTCSASSNS